MMPRQGPSDANELAFDMMQRFLGEDAEPVVDGSDGSDERAARGRKGGLARSKALSPAERSEAARNAAEARWEKSGG